MADEKELLIPTKIKEADVPSSVVDGKDRIYYTDAGNIYITCKDGSIKKMVDIDAALAEFDSSSVQILSETQTEADIDEKTVLAFSLATSESDTSYTKTQSDVKYAKAYEVGEKASIVVPNISTLVEAINKVWLSGLDHMTLDSATKTLNLITRAGVTVPFDISQIILNTNIEEFKNVLTTNLLDGQSLVYSASKQKWINKLIDSSGMLAEAKKYTDEAVEKINKARRDY